MGTIQAQTRNDTARHVLSRLERLGWSLLLVLSVAGTALHAQEIKRQEAVARLARERTLAETCAALLKKYGNKATQARLSMMYGEAKADYDGLIAGLAVALARREQPGGLRDLQAQTQRDFDKREAFCQSVEPLVPNRGEGPNR